ncbi:hypothetical protein HYE69_07000 [Staphylococcus sp. GSSP0090]|nr:hypothetical protein [Staphylococcus sp. GSSP0090]
MKKVLFLLLASFLVLAACGNKEESRLDDKKKSESSKKDDKKSNDSKKSDNEKSKSDDKQNEDVATQDETTQSQEQVNSQNQQPVQSQEQTPVAEEQATQQEPTEQEKMEANAKVAKEKGYTGIPNGDVGMLDENYTPEDDSEKTFDYENNGVLRTPSQQKAHEEWVNGQDEWMNASESEREEIRKADAEKYGYEYDPSDYGE